MNTKLSLSQKIINLRCAFATRNGGDTNALIAGKFTAIGALLVAFAFLNPDLLGFGAHAADPALKGNDIVNPINTVWTLVAAFLVFGALESASPMLEAGFCRSRETVNVLMEYVVDTCMLADCCSTRGALRSCSATAMASSA